jgi:hypothetical protein
MYQQLEIRRAFTPYFKIKEFQNSKSCFLSQVHVHLTLFSGIGWLPFFILELPSWPMLYWPSRRIFESEIWFSFCIWSWSTNKEIFSERVQK